MRPRQFAELAAVCGTVVLAGCVAAGLAGLGSPGIESTGAPIEDSRVAKQGLARRALRMGAKRYRRDIKEIFSLEDLRSKVPGNQQRGALPATLKSGGWPSLLIAIGEEEAHLRRRAIRAEAGSRPGERSTDRLRVPPRGVLMRAFTRTGQSPQAWGLLPWT
jgi:hypothetical protein